MNNYSATWGKLAIEVVIACTAGWITYLLIMEDTWRSGRIWGLILFSALCIFSTIAAAFDLLIIAAVIKKKNVAVVLSASDNSGEQEAL